MTTELENLSQLEKLKKQKAILEARIQKAEAMNKERHRKEETRRKILLGAYYLDKIRNNGTFESVKKEMDEFLTRNSDRALFGLPKISEGN